MLVSTKKTKSFVIENKGEFDFRYSIQKLVRSSSPSGDRFGKGRKKIPGTQSSRDGSASSKTDMGKTGDSKGFKAEVPFSAASILIWSFFKSKLKIGLRESV